MAGTQDGGLRAAATNKRIHGPDFYKRIGGMGGRKGTTGGFAADPEMAAKAGAIGGKNSRRGPGATCGRCGTVGHNRTALICPERGKA